MADRVKMSRGDRARQFAPFDALKGLQEAIKLKEFEHDKILKNEISEDDVFEISNILSSLNKGDNVKIEFFQDGHIYNVEGKSQIDIINKTIKVGAFLVNFEDLRKIKKT